ncbi:MULTISPECIES: hypothetical protein [unclassified Bradyrhizobium]|uniref:hypothetical protein n=1 Tax=unclassified Bradyrhizobium TaxID=2631580 RepID=UPI0020B20A54|nr:MULTISPECIES: hypothetical protein [unclassified Bradyrhizobium]MCP3398944.1 hypothetical protein [Bradyrhizobium sp. CCGB20]MCP3407545.1 hypothetical protein [Bradyrhizobium sp. CCGB01]
MRKKRNSRFLIASGTVIAASLAASYLLIGKKNSGAVHADSEVTTDQAAAQAGARVLPSDPKLKVEPK